MMHALVVLVLVLTPVLETRKAVGHPMFRNAHTSALTSRKLISTETARTQM